MGVSSLGVMGNSLLLQATGKQLLTSVVGKKQAVAGDEAV
jgi:hypothetical protein